MTPEEIERIKVIKRANEDRWRAISGVVAVGIGMTSDGSTGLIVSVKHSAEKIRGLIPKHIEGIAVGIQEAGEIKAQ